MKPEIKEEYLVEPVFDDECCVLASVSRCPIIQGMVYKKDLTHGRFCNSCASLLQLLGTEAD